MDTSFQHSVAMPPGLAPTPEQLAVGEVPAPPEGEAALLTEEATYLPARKFPFRLDGFQRAACACIERGESVLVSAHTSAGKTVCAEYAIATALRDGQRVIYSSPIKALSNQKYRELQLLFGDVGLVTGDVTINEDASCLVMTTEILRLQVFAGSTLMREVKWVIFDEVHMLGSAARGWAIEETLILLPHSTRYVLLSATLPNADEVAGWVAELHSHACHVVHTERRPTPLRHYVHAAGGAGLYLVQQEGGPFDAAAWQAAVGGLPMPRDAEPKKPKPKPTEPTDAARERQGRAMGEMVRVILACRDQGMLPAIVFCSARRECEALAKHLVQQKLLGEQEADDVEQVFESAVRTLSEEDQALPQVRALLPLLRGGVGLHHSGLLPLLREVVELLFAEGMLRLLVATETVAMGLNLPARTVLFASPTKWDGQRHRLLLPTEYTQMSGRAGRRGRDTQGHAVLLVSHWVAAAEAEELLSRRFGALRSGFALRHSSLLKLVRAEGASASTVLSRTLRAWQARAAARGRHTARGARAAELAALDAEAGDSAAMRGADEYLQLRARLHRLGEAFRAHARRHARPWLQPGRVVRLRGGGGGGGGSGGGGGGGEAGGGSGAGGGGDVAGGGETGGGHGWGVLVAVHTPAAPPRPADGAEEAEERAVAVPFLHVLVADRKRPHPPGKPRNGAASAAPTASTAFAASAASAASAATAASAYALSKSAAASASGTVAASAAALAALAASTAATSDTLAADATAAAAAETPVVLGISLNEIEELSAVRLWIPRDLQQAEARVSVWLALRGVLDEFGGALPPLDPVQQMGLQQPELLALIEQIEAAEAALLAHPLHASDARPRLYARAHRRRALGVELRQLAAEEDAEGGAPGAADWSVETTGTAGAVDAAGSAGVAGGGRREVAMLRRLRRLGYVDASNVLLPKGRVACCIDGADELLTTELLVGGGLATELSVAEVAALASCLLQGDKPPPPADADAAGADAPPAVRGSPALVRAVRALWDARAALARETALEAGAPGSAEAAATGAVAAAGEMVVVAGEAGPALRVDLVAAVHAWVEGQSFASAWALCDGEVFEGELVRHGAAIGHI